MISIDDATRFVADEIDRVCRILLDRYRITLQGERDPEVEEKVAAYEEQLAAFRTEKLAELEREIEAFARATLH